MDFTALILAGGKSQRMGTDKALVEFRGMPLISYPVELAKKFTRDIIICSQNKNLISFGFPVQEDILKIKAPLSGIHAGLMASKTEWNLVLTCDMPNVNEDLIKILEENIDDRTEIVLPGHDGFLEPLCGFYRKDLTSVIEKNYTEEKYSPLDLLISGNHKIIDFSGKDYAFLFRNMNERKDLSE